MKLTKINKVKEIIEIYQNEEPMPTFTGLLNKLGMTYREWNKMVATCPDNVHVRTMELFKQHLEEQMEKRLIYQEKAGYYNYGALQFAMKKLNAARYGDKITTEIKPAEIEHKPKQNSLIFANESGIDITEVKAHVKNS